MLWSVADGSPSRERVQEGGEGGEEEVYRFRWEMCELVWERGFHRNEYRSRKFDEFGDDNDDDDADADADGGRFGDDGGGGGGGEEGEVVEEDAMIYSIRGGGRRILEFDKKRELGFWVGRLRAKCTCASLRL